MSTSRTPVETLPPRWIAGAVFLLTLAALVYVLRYFLVTGLAAGSVAILMARLQARVRRAFRGRGGIAAAVSILGVAIVILSAFGTYGALVSRQGYRLYEHWDARELATGAEGISAESFFKQWEQWEQWRSEFPQSAALVESGLAQLAGGIQTLVRRSLASLTSSVFYFVLFFVMLFFFLRDGELFLEYLKGQSPFPHSLHFAIYGNIEKTVKGVVFSTLLVPIAQGLLAAIGFYLFDLPAPLFWAAVLVIAATIPAVGSPFVWVPASAYLFFATSWWQGLGLLLYGILIVSSIDNIIKPAILRGTAEIHPLLGLLALLGGLLSFGPIGLLLGPVIASVFLSLMEFRRLTLAENSTEVAAVSS